jgi:hypothetical protein
MDSALSNPIVAFALRAALGSYVVYMARGFYADPFAYFRKWMPRIRESAGARKLIRGLACFCIWGGCFIVATAVATQIFGLHGLALAYALVTLAAIATWFLLPKTSASLTEDDSENDNLRRMK